MPSDKVAQIEIAVDTELRSQLATVQAGLDEARAFFFSPHDEESFGGEALLGRIQALTSHHEEMCGETERKLIAVRFDVQPVTPSVTNRENDKQPCGHPRAAIVSSDDGTQYCAWCEDVEAAWVKGATNALLNDCNIALAAERERFAKAICPYCKDGDQLYQDDDGVWRHRAEIWWGGRYQPITPICKAIAIRSAEGDE